MKLLADFPAPWSLSVKDDGAWTIFDANGREVMFCATFTGDGATISLDAPHAAELCALVNAGAK